MMEKFSFFRLREAGGCPDNTWGVVGVRIRRLIKPPEAL
jgi:hypothetical protein